MKSLLIKPFTRLIKNKIQRDRKNALSDQQKWFKRLINKGKNTAFGQDHGLKAVDSYQQFIHEVPIRDYEEAKNYFDRVAAGEKDVLWPGKPKYLAKTSGTTSGIKFIPITRDSMPNHLNSARSALLNYASYENNCRIFEGKVMFLSGSPALYKEGGINTGRLSGIVNHEIPSWLKGNQLPSFKTNCIEEWEQKVDKIVEETHTKDLRLISGIPPWVQMYFEKLLEKTGKKTVREVFPNLQLFIYGGVNYEPYRHALESIIGYRIDTLETYPASEGFIAYQDQLENNGLLLNTNSGIFFEFVKLENIFSTSPERVTLRDVKLDTDYAVILTNNAGLWAYNLGDTIRFVQLNPYRIIVSGRVKHFISAFGEHVIAKEIEQSILSVADAKKIAIREFTVAPQVNPSDGSQPFHEWFVEFEQVPDNLDLFAQSVDHALRAQNIYYDDLIKGKILRPLIIRPLIPNAFRILMKKSGKLGGQNKVPRLSNDRKIATEIELEKLILQS